MKILKIILAILVLLALIFFVRGLLTPSFTYSSEITVDKPIEEAWAVMNDESKITQWLTSIKKVEHVSGEKGKVGQVTRYTFDENGQESQVLETLKELVPNKHVAMDFLVEGAMKMDYKVDFSEKDGKTILKSNTEVAGEGMIMKSILSFMQGTMKTQEDENFKNLQKLINENKTDYFPKPELVPMEESMEN